jgi:hypothetical protein
VHRGCNAQAFQPLQRLRQSDFAGTGIGVALFSASSIVTTAAFWAEAKLDQGNALLYHYSNGLQKVLVVMDAA